MGSREVTGFALVDVTVVGFYFSFMPSYLKSKKIERAELSSQCPLYYTKIVWQKITVAILKCVIYISLHDT